MRRIKQPEQRCSLLLQCGGRGRVWAEVLTRQVSKAELFFAGKLPGQFKFNVGAQNLCCGHKVSWIRLFKLQQRVGSLDLDAFARVKLHLQRAVCFRQNTASQMLASLFKQYKQNGRLFVVNEQV